MKIVIFLVVGAVAGYLAGLVLKAGQYGIIKSLIVGIIDISTTRSLRRQAGAALDRARLADQRPDPC